MSKAPMRILLLNYEFPPIGGGAATASAEIAAHMASQGAEVVVLTSHVAGLPYREMRNGYTVVRTRVMRRRPDRCSLPEMGAFVAGATVPALRLASEFKPDVMHVFFGMPTGPVGLAVNRLKGIPYLLSLRGDDVPGRQGGALALAHRLMRPLTRQVWSKASRLVVNGEGLRQRAANTLPGRRIELVPNGVDTELFRPPDEREPGETLRLLFVGRLHRQKGLNFLLSGIAALPASLRQRVQLELVGSGPAEEELRALVGTLNLLGTVQFSGWVPRHEIASHYAAADVFVFPSFEEGMPNVVLEAMSSGNPVVATNIPGVRELVQHELNGLLVPAANAEAFTAALTRLLNDEELRRRMGAEGRKRAGRMSWAAVAAQYLEMSEEIVAESVHRTAGTARGSRKLQLTPTTRRSRE